MLIFEEKFNIKNEDKKSERFQCNLYKFSQKWAFLYDQKSKYLAHSAFYHTVRLTLSLEFSENIIHLPTSCFKFSNKKQ